MYILEIESTMKNNEREQSRTDHEGTIEMKQMVERLPDETE